MKKYKSYFIKFKSISDFLGIKKSEIFTYLFIVIFTTILSSIQPLMFGYLIDSINNYQMLVFCIIIIFSLNLFSNITNYVMQRLQFNIIKNIESSAKKKIFTNIMNINFEKYIKMEKGKLVNTLQKDAEIFSKIFIMIITIIIDLASALIVSIIMFKINYILTLIFLLAFPMNIFIFSYFGKKIRIKTRDSKTSIDKFLTIVNELLLNFKTLKAYNSIDYCMSKVDNNIKDTYRILDNRNKLSGKSSFTIQVINTILNIIIVILGIRHISIGLLSVGGLVSFNSYSITLNKNLLRLSQINSDIQEIFISLSRIEDLMSVIYECKNSTIPINIEGCFKKEINLENLNFKFDDNSPIFNNVNLKIQPNQFVTFIGANGSGKTTLFNLISKLYENYEGSILFDNINLRDIPHHVVSNKICFVFHDNIISSFTVKETFLLANPDVNEKKIITACKKVCLWDFINNLPKKLDTSLGEIILSEGQKQKLNVARALVTNADVFLLDEITSSLDSLSEEAICDLFMELKKCKTILNISHRKTLLKITDTTFEIRKNGIYKVNTSIKEHFETLSI